MPKIKMSKALKETRNRLRLTLPEMARKLGVSTTTIVNYESGRRLPDIDYLVDFATVSESPLAHWLKMRIAASTSGNAASALKEIESICRDDEAARSFVSLPLFDLQDVTGSTPRAGRIADEIPQFSTTWMERELQASPADLKLIHVDDDSMSPSLRPGDMILLDLRHTMPDREGIYILQMNGGILLKRLQALPGEIFKVSSDNAAYASFDLKQSDIDGKHVAILGRIVWVVWSGRRI